MSRHAALAEVGAGDHLVERGEVAVHAWDVGRWGRWLKRLGLVGDYEGERMSHW